MTPNERLLAKAMNLFCGLEKAAALAPNVKLQPHQREAVERSRVVPGQILNWGLGSGKSLGSMAVAEDKGGNVLVVTPAALRENYRHQLRQFVEPHRRMAYTVISYEQFKKDPDAWINRVKPTTVIADEFHRVRNPSPREPFEKVRHRVPNFLGLTGSLVNNHPSEIVPLTNLAAGMTVYRPSEFEEKHIAKDQVKPGILGRLRGVKPGTVESIKNPDELRARLHPFVHRFTGSEEFKKHVPKVVEQTTEVEMTPKQEAIYKGLQSKNPLIAYKIRHNLPPTKRELKDMNAFLVAARQVSNMPGTFDRTLRKMEDSPKLQRQVEELHASAKKDPQFRAVIYSNFLDAGVHPVVDELNRRGIPASAFTGALTDAKRRELIKDFNAGKVRVLGLSPAGGEGLDLKGVSQVNLTEEHWNPERGAQAIGRAVRFKSHAHLPEDKRQVDVRRFLAVHRPRWYHRIVKKPTSADQWIAARRAEKQRLNQQFLNALDKKEREVQA